MKKLLVLILILLSSTAFAETYYVSNTGDDDAAGTVGVPWETITKVNATTFSPGDSILFSKGDTFYGAVVVSQSGTSGNPITFGSYGTGDKPRILGTTAVTSWTLHSGSIYKAALADPINQLFLDGERVEVSRFPNVGDGVNGGGYYQIDSMADDTTITASELDNGTDWTGSTGIFLGIPWGYEAKSILTSVTDTITIPDDVYGLTAGEYFFIINHVDTLDGANQWAHDDTANLVYLWASSGDSPSGYTVEVSTEDYGFYGDERSYITIENLSIEMFEKDSIYFYGTTTNNIIIDGNDLLNSYECSVHFYDETNRYTTTNTDVTITNNLIVGNNRDGILAEGADFDISYNTIRDISLIENIGLSAFVDSYNTAQAILIYPGNSSTMSYNTVSNIGYNGIMFYGTDTNVEYNKVSSTCVTLHDCGGIYTHNESTGSSINNNITSGNTSDFGIYLDATVTGITVADNISFDNSRGMHANNLVDVVIEDNTFFDNSSVQLSITDYLRITSPNSNSNNTMSGNILFSSAYEQLTLDTITDAGSDLAVTFSSNYYLNPIDPLDIDSRSLGHAQKTAGQYVGGKEFTPGEAEYFTVIGTPGANQVINGTFDTGKSSWYVAGDWVEESPLDDGAIKWTYGDATQPQTYNLSVSFSGTKQFLLSFDTIAPSTTVDIPIVIGTVDIGRAVSGNTRTHYELLVDITDGTTDRITFSCLGSTGDIVYLDNVEFEEVTATTIDPDDIYKLYYNDTTSATNTYLSAVYEDIDGVQVSNLLTLQPFTSKVLIKTGELPANISASGRFNFGN